MRRKASDQNWRLCLEVGEGTDPWRLHEQLRRMRATASLGPAPVQVVSAEYGLRLVKRQ